MMSLKKPVAPLGRIARTAPADWEVLCGVCCGRGKAAVGVLLVLVVAMVPVMLGGGRVLAQDAVAGAGEVAVGSSELSAVAAGGRPGGGSALLPALDVEGLRIRLSDSPFTRPLDLSQQLLLTGVAEFDGARMVTLVNGEDGTMHVVGPVANSLGWRLVELSGDGGLERLQATVDLGGGRMVKTRFDEEAARAAQERARPQVVLAQQGGGERSREGGRRGPDPEMMERFRSMNEDQRRAFGEYMRENRERMASASEDERRQIVSRAVDRIMGDGERGRGGGGGEGEGQRPSRGGSEGGGGERGGRDR